MARSLRLIVVICGALLAGCSKTPKEQTMAGFKDSCYAVKTPEVTKYCDCMVEKLDAAIPARAYNDPDADPIALTRAFQATAMQLSPTCKAESVGDSTASTVSPVLSDPTYEATSSIEYNSRDPDSDSLQRMMSGMSAYQQAQFLKDFELLVYLHGGGEGEEGMGRGEVVLNGYTVEKVKTEAALAPGYIRERNAKFLQETLSDMEKAAKQNACIYQNKFGVLLPPRTYLRPNDACKHYSRVSLEAMLADASGSADSAVHNSVASEPVPVPAAATDSDDICPDLDQAITADQIDCLDRKFAKADGELNKAYKSLMASLSDSQKAVLKQEQIKWIKEKESKCDEAGKEFEGGTLEIVSIKDCMVEMTEKRLSYLNSYAAPH